MDFENEGLQALLEIAASVLVELPEERCHFFKTRQNGVSNGKCEQCKYSDAEDYGALCPEQKRLNRIETDIEYFAPDEG